MNSIPTYRLNDGVTIPQLGFGVWQVSAEEAVSAVSTALETGYRHIDTAAAYQNEEGVGKAIKESGIARNDLFITTKLWNDSHEPGDCRAALQTSLDKLGTDHVDLYLIHWPADRKYGDAYIGAWDTMQQVQSEGLIRSIGVSNFNEPHLDRLNGATPSVNQIEMHPSFNQSDLRAVLAERGIAPEAWSPLGHAKDLEHETLVAIAEQTGRTAAQVILRWHLQIGNIVIPKSVTTSRIVENFDVTSFQLSDDQLAEINQISSGNRIGPDPAVAEF